MSVASVATGFGRRCGAGSPQAGLNNGGRFLMMQRRELVTKAGIALSVSCAMAAASASGSAQALEMLPFKADGYNFWTWKGRRIHYVEQGAGKPIVLIHGFGASAFHWRYNIPELAKKYKVYAIDLLGFGWSEKALVDYEATIWMEQVSDFLREIVKEPAVLVGNSLGGFTTLFAATETPDLVRGVALLNSAGQFADKPAAAAPTEEEEESNPLSRFVVKPLKEAFQRVVLGFLFWQSKQPARVEKVLKSVYIDPRQSRTRADAPASRDSRAAPHAHGSGEHLATMPGNNWRCRRHPSLPCGGVCPHCLRDRLLRLCPDCACPRPCPCASPSATSSVSSSSAFGRAHSLVDRERRVARSLSVAVAVPGSGIDLARPPKSRVWGWASFRKPPETAGCRDVEEEYKDAVALARSRSVSTAAEAKGAWKASGWGRLIPGKIKALRRRNSTVR